MKCIFIGVIFATIMILNVSCSAEKEKSGLKSIAIGDQKQVYLYFVEGAFLVRRLCPDMEFDHDRDHCTKKAGAVPIHVFVKKLSKDVGSSLDEFDERVSKRYQKISEINNQLVEIAASGSASEIVSLKKEIDRIEKESALIVPQIESIKKQIAAISEKMEKNGLDIDLNNQRYDLQVELEKLYQKSEGLRCEKETLRETFISSSSSTLGDHMAEGLTIQRDEQEKLLEKDKKVRDSKLTEIVSFSFVLSVLSDPNRSLEVLNGSQSFAKERIFIDRFDKIFRIYVQGSSPAGGSNCGNQIESPTEHDESWWPSDEIEAEVNEMYDSDASNR